MQPFNTRHRQTTLILKYVHQLEDFFPLSFNKKFNSYLKLIFMYLSPQHSFSFYKFPRIFKQRLAETLNIDHLRGTIQLFVADFKTQQLNISYQEKYEEYKNDLPSVTNLFFFLFGILFSFNKRAIKLRTFQNAEKEC